MKKLFALGLFVVAAAMAWTAVAWQYSQPQCPWGRDAVCPPCASYEVHAVASPNATPRVQKRPSAAAGKQERLGAGNRTPLPADQVRTPIPHLKDPPTPTPEPTPPTIVHNDCPCECLGGGKADEHGLFPFDR